MRIWRVVHGEYSDYSIDGYFSTEKRAAAYRDEWNLRGKLEGEYLDSRRVEGPFVVDERVPDCWGPVFHALIYLETGRVEEAPDDEPFTTRHPKKCRISPTEEYSLWKTIYVTSPISFQHAVKVAAEERQRWLRERAR